MKLSPNQSGVSGEYLVAGKLSLLDYHVGMTLRNSEGIDLLATKLQTGKNFSVQVKTSQGQRKWALNKKVETPIENLFFIFVNIVSFDQQEYFLIKSSELAEMVKNGHQNWLSAPKKNGEKRKDTPMRAFRDKNGKYLENWKILEK